MKKVLFLILIFFNQLTFAVTTTFPLEVSYPQIGGITLPPFTSPNEFLPQYINYLYRISGAVIGILAFFSLILAAILYFTSLGSVEKLMEAKERTLGVFLGLLILFSSYFILKAIRREFVEISPEKLLSRFDEIEEGIWLCPEEIKVKDDFLSGEKEENSVYLSFETYLLLKDVLRRDWLNESLKEEIRKTVLKLITEVRKKCALVGSSAETPVEFRRPKWIFISGNYGGVLHVFPNFKGYCLPLLISKKPRIDGKEGSYAGASANEIYKEIVSAGGLPERFFSFEVSKLAGGEFEKVIDFLPKMSISVFSDYLLNYADYLLEKENAGHFPHKGKITFFAFRNFNEEALEKYKKPNAWCPTIGLKGPHGGTLFQPCSISRTFKVKEDEKEKKGTLAKKEVREYQLEITEIEKTPQGDRIHKTQKNVKIEMATALFFTRKPVEFIREEEYGFSSYQPYSIRIKSFDLEIKKENSEEKEVEKRERDGEWILIVWGEEKEKLNPASPLEDNIKRILTEPQFWCDIFSSSDSNLEDNYISYFCEEKLRAKRYPCLDRIIIFPGQVIRVQKRL